MYKWTPDRFWEKVDRRGPDECWEWQGARTSPGQHGISMGPGKKKATTHRIAWMLERGPIPEGQYVLHHCDNPPCVNPAHLFVGSLKDNSRDAAAKGRLGQAARRLTRVQLSERGKIGARVLHERYGRDTAVKARAVQRQQYLARAEQEQKREAIERLGRAISG